MSVDISNGHLVITCDKCTKRLTLGEAMILATAAPGITVACSLCSVLLAKQWKDKGVVLVPALTFFKPLTDPIKT